MDEPTSDGRLLKGRRRRRALLDATIRVIGRGGVAGVSQRVVAAEAGVPASAVPYYFPTVDDLLLAVLIDVNDHYIAAVQRCVDDPDPLAAMARLIAAAGDPDAQSATAAEFELFLLPGRGERWQREYQRWTAALDAFFARYVDSDLRTTVASATVDGLLVRCYCHPDAFDTDQLRTILRAVTGA